MSRSIKLQIANIKYLLRNTVKTKANIGDSLQLNLSSVFVQMWFKHWPKIGWYLFGQTPDISPICEIIKVCQNKKTSIQLPELDNLNRTSHTQR